MKINCIIIEDEPLALERAKDYVGKLPFLHLVGTFETAVAALLFLKSNTIDLIILDINLGEISGIQLLESTKIDSQIIITSAYEQYALKGYELNVTDYLLKPYPFERFFQAVQKAKENIERSSTKVENDFIFVKTEYRLEKINLDEILFIEGMRDYRRIHTTSKRIMTLQTFKEFEEQIDATKICRVHKSYMVSINKIESIERDEIKIGEMMIPISETYKKNFLDIIKNGFAK
jgi:DNA-binding LytR/AlgR family response regulator